jgi:hypothetical protein
MGYSPVRLRPVSRGFVGLCLLAAVLGCGRQVPEEKGIEFRFRDVPAQPSAVSEVLPLVSSSHQPQPQHLSPAEQSLFTYLARTPAAELVGTAVHGHGTWRMEKVFILDDCVAVQMSEGHYLETLFFVQFSQGWRLAARIRPEDHT